MVRGTDPVATLPRPVGTLTYNEWHALVMGGVTALPPALALATAFVLVSGGHSLAGAVFAGGAFAYAGLFSVLATAARFLDGVPVLREAWYFLFTHMAVTLLGGAVPLAWLSP